MIKTWSEIINWSDTGLHFRCNRVLAHAAYHLPERFKTHATLKYGLECHSKNILDALFGMLEQELEEYTALKEVRSIAQLVVAHREIHAAK